MVMMIPCLTVEAYPNRMIAPHFPLTVLAMISSRESAGKAHDLLSPCQSVRIPPEVSYKFAGA